MNVRFVCGNIVLLTLTACSTSVIAQDSWLRLESGTDSTLLALTFVSQDTGFAVGYGTILRTFDAGETWEDISPDSTALQIECPDVIVQFCMGFMTTFRSIAFWPSGRGIALGADFVSDPRQGRFFQTWVSGFFRSTDWGNTWTKIYTVSNLLMQRVCFLSEFELIAMGDLGTLLRSVDQGLTWQKEVFFPGLITAALECPGNDVVWAGGASQTVGTLADNMILRSTDGGSSFDRLYSKTLRRRPPVAAINVITVGSALAVSYTELLATVDTGLVWSALPIRFEVADISFVDRLNGLAIWSDGEIGLTEDGGQTWATEYSDDSIELHSVHLWPDGNALAVGESGTILKRISMGPVSVRPDGPADQGLAVSHFPNPAGGPVVFEIAVPRSESEVRLEIFDVLGRSVGRVFDGSLSGGRHTISWSARTLRNGLYLYALRVGGGRSRSGSFLVAR